ncbi:UNVERIFIED_CONTAM: Aspartyl protease family protein [Sesamum radiatum]|uniref:Aspartyl protease family protein n=1 Tax=Sesamum radiatum TaxID=300843 RepID=A0AAW2KIZ0_SESRA
MLLLHITTLSRFEKVASQLIGLRLRLIGRDSSLSPAYLGLMSHEQRIETYFNISRTRLGFFSIFNETTSSKAMLHFRNASDYFMVQLGIGNPKQNVYLNFDTAISPLTWAQCQGDGYYDQHKSRTYRKIRHNSHTCTYPIFRRKNGDCIYKISYPNGGSASGVAAIDRFTFLTVQNTTTNVNNIRFGCTKKSNNINYGPGSGILSMNKSPESLITQLSSIVGGRFSYCLFLNPSAQGYLSLGKLRLKIHKDALHNNRRNTGFLIDTNTVLSNIHRAAYIRIRRVLVYRGGADFRVPAERVFLLNKDNTSFCLGLMPTGGPTVLGVMQQHNMRFTYDVNKGTVSFSPDDCVASEKA